MSVPARTKYLVLSILFIFASINFTRTALEILENSRRLDTLSIEVSELEKKKSDLENAVSYKQTETYIEEKARNDLSLIRPGEKVYVIPESIKEAAAKKAVLGDATSTVRLPFVKSSNLRQWINLFL